MIDRTDTSTISPVEAPVQPVTVQAVSADDGLRVLVTLPTRECMLDGSAARTLAAQIIAAADLISSRSR